MASFKPTKSHSTRTATADDDGGDGGGQEDGSTKRVFVTQVWRPEFNPLAPLKSVVA